MVSNNDSVVYSVHFVDKMPTDSNPLPTLNLGYQLCRQPVTGRQLNKLENKRATETVSLMPSESSCGQHAEDWLVSEESRQPPHYSFGDAPSFAETSNSQVRVRPSGVAVQLAQLKAQHFKQTMTLRTKTRQLLQLMGPVNKLLLKTDKDTLFYTGIPTKKLFYSLCRAAHKFSNARSKPSQNVAIRLRQKYKMNLKGTLDATKLSQADQILLTLMKLRLGLLHKDLSDR